MRVISTINGIIEGRITYRTIPSANAMSVDSAVRDIVVEVVVERILGREEGFMANV
jgi:hypothetical protein